MFDLLRFEFRTNEKSTHFDFVGFFVYIFLVTKFVCTIWMQAYFAWQFRYGSFNFGFEFNEKCDLKNAKQMRLNWFVFTILVRFHFSINTRLVLSVHFVKLAVSVWTHLWPVSPRRVGSTAARSLISASALSDRSSVLSSSLLSSSLLFSFHCPSSSSDSI